MHILHLYGLKAGIITVTSSTNVINIRQSYQFVQFYAADPICQYSCKKPFGFILQQNWSCVNASLQKIRYYVNSVMLDRRCLSLTMLREDLTVNGCVFLILWEKDYIRNLNCTLCIFWLAINKEMLDISLCGLNLSNNTFQVSLQCSRKSLKNKSWLFRPIRLVHHWIRLWLIVFQPHPTFVTRSFAE